MRRLRFRVTTKRMMALVAVAAIFLWWGVTRPYPTEAFESAACYVSWSNGTMSVVDGPNGITFRGTSWFQIVDWPDGTTSYYLVLR